MHPLILDTRRRTILEIEGPFFSPNLSSIWGKNFQGNGKGVFKTVIYEADGRGFRGRTLKEDPGPATRPHQRQPPYSVSILLTCMR
jgi:hypothetical protein